MDWVVEYIGLVHSPTEAAAILADVDRWYSEHPAIMWEASSDDVIVSQLHHTSQGCGGLSKDAILSSGQATTRRH